MIYRTAVPAVISSEIIVSVVIAVRTSNLTLFPGVECQYWMTSLEHVCVTESKNASQEFCWNMHINAMSRELQEE
jgi:hypothetical protein